VGINFHFESILRHTSARLHVKSTFMPGVILATQEAVIRRIMAGSQLRQIVCETIP
jgi:hypothetical protein